MKERGIIFDAESVRAILAGAKSQSRRAIKPQPDAEGDIYPFGNVYEALHITSWEGMKKARYQPGDRLYVKEAHTYADVGGFRVLGQYVSDAVAVDYRADAGQLIVGVDEDIADQVSAWIADREVDGNGDNWRSPLHMPKWAARIWLEVTAVRVERLQSISFDDVIAEGLDVFTLCPGVGRPLTEARALFADRWDAINRRRGFSWESNCWVLVYEFRKITP